MASPAVERIGQASKDAWPQVSAGVAIAMRSAYEIAQISEEVVPKVEEYVARGKTGTMRRRKICEETVWVLASLGWLRTGPERDVLQAARAWAEVVQDPDASDDEVIAADDTLLDTIKSLPECMTTKES